jgi:hypothetical protein
VRPFSMRHMLVVSLAAALGASGCCSSGSGEGDGGDGGTAGTAGSAGNGTTGSGGTNGGMAGGASNGGSTAGGNCADGAQWIYTVDQNNTLSAFHPDTLTFDDIGTLSCPSAGATPFSMAVDRNAVAWVLFSSGAIFQVNTSDASCVATAYVTGQDGLDLFGMGFSADQSTASANGTDTLFIAGGTSVAAAGTTPATLATVAFPSLTVTTVGSVTEGWPELTGTADGELWGFFPSPENTTTTPRIAQIDKTSGADVSSFPLASIAGSPAAWAQGFYGGAFFIFLQLETDASTNVYEVQRADGGFATALSATGRTIVGAGVSTCAPLSFE